MSRIARIARHALWPVFVLASTAAFAFGFEHLGLIVTFPLVATAQFLCLFAAEKALPLNDSGTFRSDPETNRDVFHNIIGQGFGNQLGATLVVGASALLAGLGGERFGASFWPAHWPFVVQVLASFVPLVSDLLGGAHISFELWVVVGVAALLAWGLAELISRTAWSGSHREKA